jgi:hypothetical protein
VKRERSERDAIEWLCPYPLHLSDFVGRMRLSCLGCRFRKSSKEESSTKRDPRQALPRIRTHRLATGGLKSLHCCGRMSLSILDLLSPVIGSRSPSFGIRMYSGRNGETWGVDCDMRDF